MPSLWAPPIGMRRSPPPPARRGGIESALLAPGVSRSVEYRRDAEHHGVSPFEDLARLARRLDALRDDDDDDDAEDSPDVDARLAAAWTAARRAADGRAELRPALTLLAQCMEGRANVAAARREERETCARAMLATVNELRSRVVSALDEEGLLEPARRAWSAARSSPDAASPPAAAAARVVSPAAEFEEDVAAIDAARRRTSALPAPLGITPVGLVPEPEPEPGRRERRRREETDERVRKQRRDFSFDLVTPTLSTTPDEEDEGDEEGRDAIRRDDQNQNQNQTEDEEDGDGEDDGEDEGGDTEVEENARRCSAKRSDPAKRSDDGEESGYSAEAELTPSVRESLSLFGGGTQSQ